MLLKTHIAISAFFILLFFSHVTYGLAFALAALFATILPDIDCAYSTLGKKKVFRFLQFFVKHRGSVHSYSFCILSSVVVAFFLPVLAFGFFLGYAMHLFADSFTVEGIMPFWPNKKKSAWKLKTGSRPESMIFLGFLIADAFLIVFIFF